MVAYLKALALIVLLMVPHTNLMAIDNLPLIVRVSDYPPYYFRNEQGEWLGIEIEVLEEVLKEAGLDYEYMQMPWGRALEQMKIGEVNIMLALSRTAEREKYIDYVGASRYEQMVLVVKKENINMDIKRLDDFTKFNKQFGLQIRAYYPNLSERIKEDESFKKHFFLVKASNQNPEMTVNDHTLGFFEDKSNSIYAIRTNPKYEGLVIHSFSLAEPTPVYIGVSRKVSLAVRTKLKEAYVRLEKEGVLTKILDKWSN